MIDSKHLLAATASFVRTASGQVVTSVAAALCVAAITNAVVGKPQPVQPPAIVLVAPSTPSAEPVDRAGRVAAAPQAASFTITGAFPMQAELAHGFPMDGDPGFQTSLSRPFAALAGGAWAEPRLSYTVMAADEPAPTPRRKLQAAKPARPAPVVVAAVAEPPAAQGAVVEQADHDGPRIFGFRTPKLLPSMGDVVGGVTAAASSLTRLARFD
ncbi:hypothetical protein GCM10007036_46940 [Alsobacter metallidurans]|uniref:Uncharacterized protein n=1 Tax=Alsobacter metallidurans TaxID=340221 RepID=A0A917IDS5_9HYPH|nr:hypothetical protein [Alsobacter metallidurans]GGH33912.1 hypothetical protein GCM10007036_46940 [Alsobacter metallidurans]